MSFVQNGYLSIQEALNRLGRELFPLEWTGEEHKARRGLISEEEWLRIQRSGPGTWWGCAGQRAHDAKYAWGETGGTFERRSFRSFLPRGVQGEAAARRCTLLEAGQLEAAILDPFTGALHQATTSLAVARDQSDALRGSSSIPRRR